MTLDEASFYGMSFEAKTLDYINRIDDVERFAKDLRIDRKIIQKYKILDRAFSDTCNSCCGHFDLPITQYKASR